MPRSSPDLKELTAYHEAGHAIMALLMGRPIQKVSIHASSLRLGAVTLQKGQTKALPDPLEAEVLILLAGMAAEARRSGSYNLQGASQDLKRIEALALKRSPNANQASKWIHKQLDKTHHLLSKDFHWRAVKAVAQELLLHENISGRAVKHCFDLAQQAS